MRVVGVADTDSYVKWAAALLGGLPPEDWDVELLVLDTPRVVSAEQERAALAGAAVRRVSRVSYAELEARLAAARPDAVLIAALGPLVRVVARLVAGLTPRPVIVSGLPGISVPATRKALVYRRQCDLFVLHSLREVREFRELARSSGIDLRFALTRLPFAAGGLGAEPAPGIGARRATSGGTDLVFAAQAVVPRESDERLRVARLLVRAAEADPSRRVVLKLRARPGEQQTHGERHSLADLVSSLGPVPENLVLSTGPMSLALERAQGLVTVSSTAAIEAVASGVPVIVLDTFGVSSALINEVFLGSALFGDEENVVARRFRHPEPSWLRENYFHPAADDDFGILLQELVARRREGRLAPKPALRRAGGRLREAWDRKLVLGDRDRTLAGAVAWTIGMPLRPAVRALHRARSLATTDLRARRA